MNRRTVVGAEPALTPAQSSLTPSPDCDVAEHDVRAASRSAALPLRPARAPTARGDPPLLKELARAAICLGLREELAAGALLVRLRRFVDVLERRNDWLHAADLRHQRIGGRCLRGPARGGLARRGSLRDLLRRRATRRGPDVRALRGSSSSRGLGFRALRRGSLTAGGAPRERPEGEARKGKPAGRQQEPAPIEIHTGVTWTLLVRSLH